MVEDSRLPGGCHTIDHRPELTLQGAMAVFSRHFDGRYRVRKPAIMIGKWFTVERTPFTAARVALKQTSVFDD